MRGQSKPYQKQAIRFSFTKKGKILIRELTNNIHKAKNKQTKKHETSKYIFSVFVQINTYDN